MRICMNDMNADINVGRTSFIGKIADFSRGIVNPKENTLTAKAMDSAMVNFVYTKREDTAIGGHKQLLNFFGGGAAVGLYFAGAVPYTAGKVLYNALGAAANRIIGQRNEPATRLARTEPARTTRVLTTEQAIGAAKDQLNLDHPMSPFDFAKKITYVNKLYSEVAPNDKEQFANAIREMNINGNSAEHLVHAWCMGNNIGRYLSASNIEEVLHFMNNFSQDETHKQDIADEVKNEVISYFNNNQFLDQLSKACSEQMDANHIENEIKDYMSAYRCADHSAIPQDTINKLTVWANQLKSRIENNSGITSSGTPYTEPKGAIKEFIDEFNKVVTTQEKIDIAKNKISDLGSNALQIHVRIKHVNQLYESIGPQNEKEQFANAIKELDINEDLVLAWTISMSSGFDRNLKLSDVQDVCRFIQNFSNDQSHEQVEQVIADIIKNTSNSYIKANHILQSLSSECSRVNDPNRIEGAIRDYMSVYGLADPSAIPKDTRDMLKNLANQLNDRIDNNSVINSRGIPYTEPKGAIKAFIDEFGSATQEKIENAKNKISDLGDISNALQIHDRINYANKLYAKLDPNGQEEFKNAIKQLDVNGDFVHAWAISMSGDFDPSLTLNQVNDICHFIENFSTEANAQGIAEIKKNANNNYVSSEGLISLFECSRTRDANRIENRISDYMSAYRGVDASTIPEDTRDMLKDLANELRSRIGNRNTGLVSDGRAYVQPKGAIQDFIVKFGAQGTRAPNTEPSSSPERKVFNDNLTVLHAVLKQKNGQNIQIENPNCQISYDNNSSNIIFKPNDMNNKFQLNISNGKINYVIFGGKIYSPKNIPNECKPYIQASFSKALREASTYRTGMGHYGGLQIEINVIGRAVREDPQYHLNQLSGQLNNRGAPSLFVNPLGNDLQQKAGIDAGGLGRNYLDDLFGGLLDGDSKINNKPLTNGLSVPVANGNSLTDQETQSYRDIGKVLMYCRNSSEKQSYCIGRHFDPSIFSAAFALTPEEVATPVGQLTPQTQQKMITAMLEHLRDNTYNLEGVPENENLPVTEINTALAFIAIANWKKGDPIPKLPENWEQLDIRDDNYPIELRNLIALCSLWVDKVCEGIDDDEKYTKDGGMVPDLKKITDNFEKFIEDIQSVALNYPIASAGLSDLPSSLAPIHQMASGMLSAYEPRNREREWNQMRLSPGSVQRFDLKVQGSINRQKIIDCIQSELPRDISATQAAVMRQKISWLKDWILDENTTEEEVKGLLKFITGTSSLAAGVNIKIVRKMDDNDDPTPRSHTCFNSMELYPKYCKGAIRDDSREAFYSLLKIEAKEKKTDTTED